ncbi:MAG: hypothetical protein FWG13_01455 [Leptospirales bacterium]|nr:hypothetical protein [Leptospirales bacterium]
MKNKFFCITAIITAIAFASLACGGGGDSSSSGSTGNPAKIVYFTSSGGDSYRLTISKEPIAVSRSVAYTIAAVLKGIFIPALHAQSSAYVIAAGDSYKFEHNGTLVSSGTITEVNGSAITFQTTTGHTFSATLVSDDMSFAGGKIKRDDGDELAVPAMKVLRWKTATAGYGHTVAIKDDGTLWAWGLNDYGQLGNGTFTNRHEPTQSGTDTNWATVTAGDKLTVAIKKDGSLWIWGIGPSLGWPDPFRLGTDTDWKIISAGGSHIVAIKNNGSLWTFGRNTNYQLGDGTTADRSEPAQVGTDTDWKTATASTLYTVAIKNDGSLWRWGQLGPSAGVEDYPVPTKLGTDTDWKIVSAGSYHTLVVKNNGSLWGWGLNANYQLGDDTTTDRKDLIRIGTATDWKIVTAGFYHTAAIKNNNSLWTWGQLGPSAGVEDYPEPFRIGTDTDWETVSAGSYHTTVIKNDGSLWVRGFNAYGQLGDGTTTNRPNLIRID